MRPVCSVLIATRGRVAKLEETIGAFFEMAREPDKVEMIVRVHDDDPETLEWSRKRDQHIRVVIGDTEQGYGSIDHFTNCMAAVSNGDWLFPSSDEFKMLTQDWDVVLKGWLADPRKELLLLTAKVATWPDSRIGIMSRGLYRVIGHFGMTEYADCYIDSLTHFAGLQARCDIRLQEGALGPVLPRDRARTWAEYRSEWVAHCFEVDKIKLGAVMGKLIAVKWTPMDAPEKP
jgi:hypothetical protein